MVVLALYYYAKPIQAEDTTTPTNPNCGPGAGTPTCRTEFTGCAARIYYRSLSSPSSVDWTREELQQLVTETQRSVLSLDGITEALMELDAAGDDEVRMFYSQVTQPAVNYIQQDGWRYARLWVNDGTVEELDIHSIRAETRRGSAGIPAGFVFGECGTLEDLDACISPAGPALPLDTAEDGTIFTPPSNVRGDIARALFYMDLKYDSLELTDCAPFDNGRFGILSQLLQWHQQDPVSEEEFARNENACEFWQGNRNPFVDYPDLVEQFYGAPQELIVEEQTYPSCLSLNDTTPTTFPPAGNETAADPSDPCAILEPGDLFLFSMSSIDQSIGFLALVDLPPTLLLYMTDRPWNGEEFLISTDSAEEGTVKVCAVILCIIW